MLRISDQEFHDFLQHRFGKTPHVFHQPLTAPLATEQEILQCVEDSFLQPYNGELDRGSRIWIEGKQITQDVASHIPRGHHRDLQAYIADMHAVGKSNVCVSSWKPHLYKNHLFDRMAAFTKPIVEQFGFPSGGIGSDIFLGDYTVTPGSLHIDGTDVFSYVAVGRKRMLVWPFEVFEEFSKIMRGGFDVLKDVDYNLFLDRAIVLEGEPGDILYWPSTYWHLAEGDGTPVATFNISFYLNNSADRFLNEAMNDVTKATELQDYFTQDDLSQDKDRVPALADVIEQERIKKDKFLSLRGIMGNPRKIEGTPDLETRSWYIDPIWIPVYGETDKHSLITCRGRTIILPKMSFFSDFVAYVKTQSDFNIRSLSAHYGFQIDESRSHAILQSYCTNVLNHLFAYGGLRPAHSA